MTDRTRFSLLYCLPLMCLWCSTHAYAQDQEPRYNRLQYKEWHWNAYHTKTFQLYFPAGYDSLCAFVARMLPGAMEQMKKNMFANIKDANVIIYPSADQQYESNIGGYENKQFTFPTFVSKGKRIVVAYTGSYTDLGKQVNEGLARSVWEGALNGDDQANPASGSAAPAGAAKKAPKSEDIPEWYQEGSIRYFANGWSIADEDQLERSVAENKFDSWQQILAYEPRLGGNAFCYFLSEQYKANPVGQVFLQLKKKKSLPRVVKLVTKRMLDTLYNQCYAYYKNRFSIAVSEQRQEHMIAAKSTIPHKPGIIQKLLVSPHEDYMAYTLYVNGKRTVYCYDTKVKTTACITSYEPAPWIDDHSADRYPLLAWQPGARQLIVTVPQKGKIRMKRYTPDGVLQETVTLYGVDGLVSVTPLINDAYLLAAYRRGACDIVGYDDRKEKYVPYTDDSYDDAAPVMTGNAQQLPDVKKGQLYFVSDRPKKRGPKIYLMGVGYKKDTLYQGLYSVKDTVLQPVAIDSAGYIKWDKPLPLDDGQLLVTQTIHGTEQFALLDDIHHKVTMLGNYRPYQYLPETKRISFYTADKDSLYVEKQDMAQWMKRGKVTAAYTNSPWLADMKKRVAAQTKEDSMLHAARDTTNTFMRQLFTPKDNKKDKEKKDKGKKKETTGGGNTADYDPKKVAGYVMELHSAYFTAKVNNDYFINRYQPFLNNQGQFKFPEIGGMAQGGFTDVLENHHFTIAYRVPSSTQGSDFFARYENTTQMTDWGLSYYRDVESLQPDPSRNWVDENGNPYPNTAKVKTHYYEVFIHRPLNYDCAVGVQTAVRYDRTIFQATDRYSLDFANIESIWSVTTFSFTLNKLKPTLPFLYKGFYAKVLTDVFKEFSQDEAILAGGVINVAWHKPLYKYISVVLQQHVGISGGDKKILYNLGGEDNNVTPRVDTSVHFAQNAPYAFQTIVTPFRGYYQNSLYGDMFSVTNADVYFPIFQTLIPLQTPLPSVNNLQLGIFGDVGTAIETWNPANKKNSTWLYSYGLSARTMLAGYPLRLDVAWPGNIHAQPVWYFTLSLQ